MAEGIPTVLLSSHMRGRSATTIRWTKYVTNPLFLVPAGQMASPPAPRSSFWSRHHCPCRDRVVTASSNPSPTQPAVVDFRLGHSAPSGFVIGATGSPSIADDLPGMHQIVANIEGRPRQPAAGAPEKPAAVAGGRG